MTQVKVVLDERIGKVNPNIFGHFIEHLGRCVYEGIFVGPESKIANTRGLRNDVIDALRKIEPSILRWPGGCFADDYHWRDGIGCPDERPRTVNINWGYSVDSNAFGTHEFIDFCRLIGAEPYICANVGTGTPQEARNWVEYCNFPGDSSLARLRRANGSEEPFNVKYWGIGNELWGCGGSLPPGDYAIEVRRFASFMRDFGGGDMYKIACGPRGDDPCMVRRDWVLEFFEGMQTQTLSDGCRSRIDGFALHYYTRGAGGGGALDFSEHEYYWLLNAALAMESLIRQVRTAMDVYDPCRKVGLVIDEWGTWHPEAKGDTGLEQQNTMRDALVAALHLDIFIKHADKVVMTNIAQTINVLQALILTKEDKMLLTPTYHVFDIYKQHQGGTSVRVLVDAPTICSRSGESCVEVPQIAGAASLRDDDLFLTLTNSSISDECEIQLELLGLSVDAAKVLKWEQLVGIDATDHNTFEDSTKVRPQSKVINWDKGTLVLPPHSVNAITVGLK